MSKRSSVWLDTVERPPRPRLDGVETADVVVVGAGITGLTAARLFQRDGARVVVVEADRVGSGTSGGTTGKITSQHGIVYARLIERHGEGTARRYASANQHAIDMIEGLVRATGTDCEFERVPAYVYTTDRSHRTELQAEHTAAIRLGLPSALTTETELPFPVELALRFDDQARFHPGKYLYGLARAIERDGGVIFEHSRVEDVKDRSDRVEVHTDSGSVTAAQAVVATLLPIKDPGAFFARTRPSRAYGVSAFTAEPPPSGMYLDAASPTRSLRPWSLDGRQGIVVVGENHPTGHGSPSSGRWGELERWAREHFEIESFEHRWSAQDYETHDQRPFVGRAPFMRRTLIVTGLRKWGITNGVAAAEMLTDIVAGRRNPWFPAFDASRAGDLESARKTVQRNVHVAKTFLTDRLRRLGARSVEELAPGEGSLAKLDGRTVAAYCDPGGEIHAVSPTCTHLGCTLDWNDAENTWDCPCHGSRFDCDGDVIAGPAVRPLRRFDAAGVEASPVVSDPE